MIFSFHTKQSGNHIRGFTLVELLVSMAIFTSVITIATGALFSAQSVNVKLEQTQNILDGVNLATEVIVRDIRYGEKFHCDTAVPASLPVTPNRLSCSYELTSGGSVLIFKPSVPLTGSTVALTSLDRVVYYLSSAGVLYKDEYADGVIANKVTYQITSPDVKVARLLFYVSGADCSIAGCYSGPQPDLDQPLITLVMWGVTVPSKGSTPPVSFSIQTSISPRGLDK